MTMGEPLVPLCLDSLALPKPKEFLSAVSLYIDPMYIYLGFIELTYYLPV